jgi:hypothetical protein
MTRYLTSLTILVGCLFSCTTNSFAATIKASIVDAKTMRPIPARVYIERIDAKDLKSRWHFAESASPDGRVAIYNKTRAAGKSVEMHTAVSAHPFIANVPAGKYRITVESGKEYRPWTKTTILEGQGVSQLEIRLARWIHMAEEGWFSGDTHIHLPAKDLPTFVAAEDLNIAFPMTGWVTRGYDSPLPSYSKQTGKVQKELVKIDDRHLIHPLNTEWEIFTVKGKRHTLGAVFAIGHKEPFTLGAPPVAPIAKETRRQGGLLELDKHNWPWSMMIIPVMDVDLFELTNNHIWRTEFAFTTWYPEYTAAYMNVEKDKNGGFTERGWIEFGFQNYYTMLNCGFRMRPTAGTAAGVHPVFPGFGRVYVEQPNGFSRDNWLKQLDAGRSFVTTGPMLRLTLDGKPMGSTIQSDGSQVHKLRVTIDGIQELSNVEIIVNGIVTTSVDAQLEKTKTGAWRSAFSLDIPVKSSSWIAVRCFTNVNGRPRFAHSSPFHIDVANKPLHPRKAEIDYLIKRVEDEINRHKNVLPTEVLDEYQQALATYKAIKAKADQ